jgi:hypothetical protein
MLEQLRTTEAHWAARLEHETAMLREHAQVLAASEQEWRTRAHDYETYWRQLRDRLPMRLLRALGRILRRGQR